ncbi:WD repeat-containing protein [Hirsutella rhossiliensis]|uniref:WD repeat-containing protein n=1 Tax=Hirsutella rhossiliensis TaxID=111463 RepID=A0A9P8N3W7_9HYPO|nr:WD repeat-containing protein [Hirsutella rhossiliensis]KAH0966435.1 WD repeat-containing protein [Hirsutella rhossiliensis]
MSTALTATLPRAVIDLTGDAATPPRRGSLRPPPPPQQQQGQIVNGGRRAPCDEPPAKRRRSEHGASGRRSLRACVQEQILPHVVQAVECLSREQYRVDDIAVQTVAALARSSAFRIVVDEAHASPLPLPQAQAAIATSSIINKLKALPQYRIRPLSFIGREATHKAARPKPLVAQPNAPRGGSCGIPKPRAQNALQARRRTRGQPTEPWTGAKWFRLGTRPYLPATERDLVAQGARHPIRPPHGVLEWPFVYHVDFTQDEIGQIFARLSECLLADVPRTIDFLTVLCYEHNVASIVGDAIQGRSGEDLRNFCSDLMAGRAAAPDKIKVLSLDQDLHEQRRENRRVSRIPSLLLARELEGNARFGRSRRFENFQNEFKKADEDGLAVIAEFTNCAGDLSAMSWVPDGNILCGTTAHSDSHNQQYNKLGNLLLCSTSRGTLRAFADHRIPRPLVESGENSTEAMRRSQDPWLYTSVVSSDYDEVHGRAFTSGFDRTVKVWAISQDGDSMEAMATWHHGGNVNFVAAAKDGSGRVASAADVPSEAVRVYTVRADDVGQSPYQAISCSRTDAAGSVKWAYFPATMQWGRAPGTTHFLIVGYSPRSLTNDDQDIPEDKRNSGEIMLWDAARGCRRSVMTATTANVFEVAWHPTLQRFIVATSPSGLSVEHGVCTQIHLFQLDRERQDGAYHEFQKLDCPAADINELTLVPNSLRHAYVTAACTDGNVYVWDTAQGDDPIHILKHGYPLDDFSYDREKEDTGVKFTAWGSTLDRLYTGSSDGVVKVWNVRNRHNPFVRHLLEAPGPISIGAFSPDHSKLAIGDATGRLFLLSVDKRDEHEAHFVTLPGSNRRVRRPTPFIPHPEPPPPQTKSNDPDDMQVDGEDDDVDDDEAAEHSIAVYTRQAYLDSGQLVLHPNPVVGAVQGPEYASTGLFRPDAHLDEDPARPLLTEFQRLQRQSLDASHGKRRRSERRLKNPPPLAADADEAQHAANCALDFEGLRWDFADLWELLGDGAVMSDDGEDWGFAYEDGPAGESEGE